MTKTAITYLRSRGDGPSIDWQRQVCCEAAKRLGVTITQEYVERSEGSARPERERMMRDLTGDSRSDLLVIASDDRLTRMPRDRRVIEESLRKADVQLVVASLVTDGLSLAGLRLIQGVRDFCASRFASGRGNQTRRKEQG